jgi:ribosome-binding protein aMBF1 (putative translation factor)
MDSKTSGEIRVRTVAAMADMPRRVRALREERGLSLEDLSAEIDLPVALCASWELAGANPSAVPDITAMIQFYGVCADWLLLGKLPKHPDAH